MEAIEKKLADLTARVDRLELFLLEAVDLSLLARLALEDMRKIQEIFEHNISKVAMAAQEIEELKKKVASVRNFTEKFHDLIFKKEGVHHGKICKPKAKLF